MKQIHVINVIEVPNGMEQTAIDVREEYVDYFKTKHGFIGSTFYRSINTNGKFNFINIVIWDCHDSYMAVVNSAATDKGRINDDGMKVLGNGFPHPIVIHPDQYEIIGS